MIREYACLGLAAVMMSLAPTVVAQKNDSGYDASVPKPTLTAVRYGEHPRLIMDFWKAKAQGPTPVVIVIHGGGWNGGSKERLHRFVDAHKLLDAGISVAAINYRLMKHSKDLKPPVKGPLSDAARAVQFVRSMAEKWNIDPSRVAASGGSAGACSSLWLAYHDDLADPQSSDPVARQSTRLNCVAVTRPQTTLDPQQIRKWIPNCTYGAHAFGIKGFDQFLAQRDAILPWINEYSPYALLDKSDPPTYMSFAKAPNKKGKETDPTHSPIFGIKLQEQCRELGVPCEVVYPGAPNVKHADVADYLIATLKPERSR
ncbi:alpha/beta hydrolase [Verrucomicrobiaceae bacterium 5K15]|uniref:Alpha/beta hydrolase n=1 Tax=Oceaniferula flava TaxID=2800421 RepID=A0AAE2SDZ9_9BACT|nr:alpha/beta hydrolase [Oceaniferula flavus]MBK1855667.1 alpha/beta hydrolase [Oceaniferula flavus]MBM1136973.1 alpha/beta hydrolase [Oceaniferula flavus]